MQTNKKKGSVQDIKRFQSWKKGTVDVFKPKAEHERFMEHFQLLKTNNKVFLVYLQ